MNFEVSGAQPLLCSLVSALVATRFPEATVSIVPGGTAGARVVNLSSGSAAVFLAQPTREDFVRAVSEGASVVALTSTAGEVELALAAAGGGARFVAPSLISSFAGTVPSAEEPPQLTPRERDILALVRAGLSNREIAETLSISIHTARSHLQSLSEKFGIRGRGRLAAAAEELQPTAGGASAPELRR